MYKYNYGSGTAIRPTLQTFIAMHLQVILPILALSSASFAAQLMQVANYGGSARAKPGMYVVCHVLQSMLTVIAGGCMCPIK